MSLVLEMMNEENGRLRRAVETYREALASVEHDAARYRWLADYFIGDSNEYDDAIVAAKTRQEMNGVIDDAMKQGETK